MKPSHHLLVHLTIHERCVLEAWASVRARIEHCGLRAATGALCHKPLLDAPTGKRALRASVVLAAADGQDERAIAKRLGVRAGTARKWQERFVQDRLAGLEDKVRAGAPRRISDERIAEIVVRLKEPTPDGARRWSRRMMAEATGLSRSTIHRIWRRFHIVPDGLTSAK